MGETTIVPKRNYVNAFLRKNWVLVLVLIYLVSPLDFIPEGFFPLIGSSDDALVAFLGLLKLWQDSKNARAM